MTTEPAGPSHRPPGYPADYEQWLRLRDGRTVWIRPIMPADAPRLAEAIRSADSETLHRRFLGAPPRLTPALLTWLTTVDYQRRFALIAADPRSGQGIAVARYEPLAEGVAEIAVAVDPGWRRAGLATALVTILAQAALARGIHSFTADYLADNHPVAALAAHAGTASRNLIRQGVAELAVNLDQARGTWSGAAARP